MKDITVKVNPLAFEIHISQMRNIIIMLAIAIMSYYSGNKHIMFAAATVTSIYVIFKAKISFFSAFTFILWFSFVQEYVASINKLIAAGMLKTGIEAPVYFVELFICFEIFLLCELVLFFTTSVLDRERQMYLYKINMGRGMAYILTYFSVLLAILSYPSFPTLGALLSRNEGIILSARYMPIAYYILAATYDSIKKYKSLLAGWAIVLVWSLFHGERVAAFGFLVYIGIKYLNIHSDENMNLLKMLFQGKRKIVVITAVLVVVLGVYIQYARMGINNGGVTLARILAQGTSGDVVYVFNCSVDLWKQGKLLHGYTLLQYLTAWLPGGTNMALSPSVCIKEYYYTVGGGLFFVEPIMNFGIAGVFPYVVVFLWFLNFVLRKPSLFTAILWIPFMTTIFRMVWYTGLTGWTFALYTTPFIYFAIKKIK